MIDKSSSLFSGLSLIPQDNQVKAALGASGGAMIFSAVGEIFLNHFARGMDPLSSIMAPRIYHQVSSNYNVDKPLFSY